MDKGKLLVITLILLALAGACVGLGWWLNRPAVVAENAAPAEMQADGSTIAERRPDAKARPKHQVPKGAKVERTGEITVQGGTPAGNAIPCPPVSIDTTLIRNKDGSKRVIVSSPDGQVTKAIDIPVETAEPPPEPKKWAAGVSYNPVLQTGGVWVERDLFERVRLGAEIQQARQFTSGPTSIETRLRLGWTF